MSIVQPDFSKIFASGAAVGELLNWPDESYLRGWGYLKESEPPPMEFFNALANLSDTKDNYLFQAISIRKNKTQYHIDDIVTTPNVQSKYQLICIQEGVSAEAEPTWPDEDGVEVADGACKWRVTAKVANGIAIAEDEPANARDYSVWLALNGNNDIAKLKYRTPQKTWKQLLIESKLSAVIDSPIKSLERNTSYQQFDILSETTLPQGGFLVCETQGITGASVATAFSSAAESDKITDGTAVFSVHYFANLASLISPEFSGTPTAPTVAKTANNTQIATTAFVHLLADSKAQLNSSNTFTALNKFSANLDVSNGTKAGSSGSISFGIAPAAETVQARIGTDMLGGLFYQASTNQPHVFRNGSNIKSLVIRANDTNMNLSSGNTMFATVNYVGGVRWLGNADTASKLETARTINGVEFDGTQDITIYNTEGHLVFPNGAEFWIG